MGDYFFGLIAAISRARVAMLTITLTYSVSLSIGIAMAHTGNDLALNYRDGLVARAHASDPALIYLDRGDRLNAALLDFNRNLFLGAVPGTGAGLSIIIPYFVAAYRGWVGGIVSVDKSHISRFANSDTAIYYLLVLITQLIPYILATGAGVNLGLAYLRPAPHYQGTKWFGLPIEAIRDVMRIYLIVVPLFFIASMVEFFAF